MERHIIRKIIIESQEFVAEDVWQTKWRNQ